MEPSFLGAPPEKASPAGDPVRGAALGQSAPAAELQTLADEMLRRATVTELPSEIAVQLELEVPLLRHVGVELRFGNGRLRARLEAADRAAFDRLRAAAPELEEALRRRGLDADRVEVKLH